MLNINGITTMPRPTKRPMHKEYLDLANNTALVGERGDCAVKAIAAIAKVPYATAHAALAAQGRKNRSGTYQHQTHGALKALGYRVTEVGGIEFLRQYPSPHCFVLRGITSHHPDRFARVWRDGKSYLMHTTSHVLACVNGEVIDWSRNKALRVRWIYRVEKVS